MSYQQPKKPRFYIDAIQFVRANGGINSNQQVFNAENDANGIPCNEMFHNNGAKLWNTDFIGAYKNTTYEELINYSGDYDDHTVKFYKTDLAVKLKHYYALPTINYFAFLGHNFGRAGVIAEPFITYYDDTGKEEYPNNEYIWNSDGDYIAANVRLNLSDVIDDFNDAAHHYQNCTIWEGKLAFYNFDEVEQERDDELEEEEENPIEQEYDLDFSIGRDVGWAYIRFNDNNNETDTFKQVWNVPGPNDLTGRADLAIYNSIGLRLYERDETVKSKVPHLNAFSCGWTYLLDQAADLDIQMSFEFDGIKTKTGLAGQNLTNINYQESTPWQFMARDKGYDGTITDNYTIADVSAWYQHNSIPTHNASGFRGYKGRRIWKLKFSYMQKTDLFDFKTHSWSMPAMIWDATKYDTPYRTTEGFSGLENHFLARVINGTLGGKLPFLFQPDSEVNEDLFLCEFADNGIDFKQVAPGVWSFDLTIREVW